MGQIRKLMPLLYQIPSLLISINKCLFFYLTDFRVSKNNFVRVLVQMRTRKFAFEINWPLEDLPW